MLVNITCLSGEPVLDRQPVPHLRPDRVSRQQVDTGSHPINPVIINISGCCYVSARPATTPSRAAASLNQTTPALSAVSIQYRLSTTNLRHYLTELARPGSSNFGWWWLLEPVLEIKTRSSLGFGAVQLTAYFLFKTFFAGAVTTVAIPSAPSACRTATARAPTRLLGSSAVKLGL